MSPARSPESPATTGTQSRKIVGVKTRVLSLARTLYFGGDQYRLLALARTIDRSAFEHKIVCLKAETPDLAERYGTLRPRFEAAGSEIIDIDIPDPGPSLLRNPFAWSALTGYRFYRSVRQVSTLVRDWKANVLDGHVAAGNHVAVAAGRLTGTPTAVTTYDVEQFAPRAVYFATQQAMLAAADRIITDAEATRRSVQKWMLKKGSRIDVVPNGLPPPTPSVSAESVRATYGLPSDPGTVVVGTIARLIPNKGQRVLIDAAKLVLERHPQAFFLIVGYERFADGYADSLRARARELGIADRVRIQGHPGDIGDVWQVVDIHVHPTLADSLPQAIMEGMSLKKPQVVTDIGGITTQVANEESGLVVPAHDPAALAHAISRLIAFPELGRRFGTAGSERYQRMYSAEGMTRSLESIFAELAFAQRR